MIQWSLTWVLLHYGTFCKYGTITSKIHLRQLQLARVSVHRVVYADILWIGILCFEQQLHNGLQLKLKHQDLGHNVSNLLEPLVKFNCSRKQPNWYKINLNYHNPPKNRFYMPSEQVRYPKFILVSLIFSYDAYLRENSDFIIVHLFRHFFPPSLVSSIDESYKWLETGCSQNPNMVFGKAQRVFLCQVCYILQ